MASPRITRRRFLQAVGAAGGAAAVLGSMGKARTGQRVITIAAGTTCIDNGP
jgi:hypothetical protein